MSLLLLVTAAWADGPRHLSVEEALSALDDHNPTLARAHAQVDAAKGNTLVALSPALPTLTATGAYTRNNEEATLDLGPLFDILGQVAEAMGQEPPDAPEGEMVLQPLEAWTGSIGVRVPIVSASTWASWSAAKTSAGAAADSEAASRSSLRASAMTAFWSAAAAEAMVTAQEESVGRARRLVETADRAVQAGTSTRLSLLESQTDLARREGDLLSARATLTKARVAVGIVIGAPEPVIVDLGAPTAVDHPDAAAAVTAAWTDRAEMRAATAARDAALAQRTAVRLGAVPSLSGSFSAFASSEPYVTGENVGWKGSVDLTWPLLQGGLRAGNEQKATAAIADAEAQLQGTRLMVAQQVHNALADLDAAEARLAVATAQRGLAAEGARVAQASYEQGIVDLKQVLDAFDRLDLAAASEIDARARLGIAESAYRTAVGRW